jgi:replicative superfamily II helicase
MAGRGGRYGYVGDFGRAILVTSSPFKKKVWRDQYIEGMLEPLEPTFRMEELEEVLLNLIACGEATAVGELAAFLRSTYSAEHRWKEKANDLEPLIESTLEKCRCKGAVLQEENRMIATALGRIIALKGIRLATGLRILEWMKAADPWKMADLEILCALALTEDARRIYISLPYRERRAKNYPSLLRKEIAYQQEEGKSILKSFFGPLQGEAEEGRAIKKALVLSEWVTSKGTSEIEQAYALHSGAIHRIGEEFSWLAEAASALAGSLGWPDEAVTKISELSERLTRGITAKGLVLSKMKVKGLGRAHIARLVKEGYDSPEALASLSIEALKEHLPERLAAALHRHFHQDRDRPSEERLLQVESGQVFETAEEYRSEPEPSPILLIDPDQQMITYRGIQVALSASPFRLLTALARTPGRVVNKVTLYDALYGSADGAGEDDRPYERQLADHKRKILAQIRKAAADPKRPVGFSQEIERLISVRRGVGYTLNLRPTDVSILKGIAQSA